MATKLGSEFGGRLMVFVLLIVVPLKFSFVIDGHTFTGFASQLAVVPGTAWFTTKTSMAFCCTAWTGRKPTSMLLMSESPETSIDMALPRTTVPLSLIDTTVWAAAGLGKVGGFGMIIGRNVSPHPVQIR